jgi:hypothetical protein
MPSDQGLGPLDAQRTRTLEAVADRLIPTDESGPGALPAGAVQYVGQALAGDYAALLPAYVAGLSSLDADARAEHGRPFAELDPDQQDAVLQAFELGPSAFFFELVRKHVMEGMFGDPSYGGNRDGAGWALLGYGGPQAVWTEPEQRIGEVG